MGFRDVSIHAGHDGRLCVLGTHDNGATVNNPRHMLNTWNGATWSGWHQVGLPHGYGELRRFADGRLAVFEWPDANGHLRLRVETAPGAGTFVDTTDPTYADHPYSPYQRPLLRGLADGRLELFVAARGRVFRTLQASPSGPFPNFVDLDGAASTPATQLLCAGETQNGVPLLWALNPDTGALHGASPSTDAWRWWRSFEGAFTTTAAWYEGRRGADELFVVTAGGTLKGFRTNLLPFPRTTEIAVRIMRGSLGVGALGGYLDGHYSGDGRLYLFFVTKVGGNPGGPAVIAETTPGSGFQADGGGWTPVQTPNVYVSQGVRRVVGTSFGTDGRLACAAVFGDGTVRVSRQALLGSSSWSAWEILV